jgi:hypothetical protein
MCEMLNDNIFVIDWSSNEMRPSFSAANRNRVGALQGDHMSQLKDRSKYNQTHFCQN